MTVEERVNDAMARFSKIVDFSSASVRRQFFRGLIEAAREDCAEIADQESNQEASGNYQWGHAAEQIAERIRNAA